jgi:hypothetical protein
VHVNFIVHDDESEFEHRTRDETIKASWNGEFELNDTESDIATMAPGASFEMEVREKGASHRIVYVEEGGQIKRTWYVGRKEQPLDDAARDWLASAFPRFLRTSAWHAEQRVAGFLARGGVQAVLDEMNELEGGYVTRVYTETLLAQADPSDAELRILCDRVGRMEGDYDLRSTLTAMLAEPSLSPQTLDAMLTVAKKIDGSYDRRTLLEGVAERPLTPDLFRLYLDIAAGIDGDYDLRSAIVTALANEGVDGDGAAQLIELAERSIQGSYDLSQVVQSAPQIRTSDTAAAAAIKALTSIEGDYDRRVSLVYVVEAGKLDARNWLAIIAVASDISGDYDRAEALTSIAAAMPLDDATKSAYRKAADAIGSEHDRSRARDALYERGA